MNTHKPSDIAVFIGRFQPFHNGHLALLQHALRAGQQVIVVIGSAFQARTPKNPFTWSERADMVRMALSADERARITFLPVRDYYDDTRWIAAVRAGVAQRALELSLPNRPGVTVVGHFKDATSEYLQRFDGWQLLSVDRAGPVDAVYLRDAVFGCAQRDLDATLAALQSAAPASTLDFVRAWAALPYLAALSEEWRMHQAYRQSWSSAPYPPVFVTVDALVRCANQVLLIERGHPPGKGLRALPGGYIEARETAYQSAVRELREETRFSQLDSTLHASLKGNAVFDHPERSQIGRTITHCFYFDLGSRPLPEVQAADDAQSASWIAIDQLAGMEDQFHDDHFHILDHFLGLTSDWHPRLIDPNSRG